MVVSVFRAAARDRIIGHNPCDGVKLPELVRGKVAPLTREQLDALVAAVPKRYRALVLMDAGTGLRQGEVFGVCLRDDDGPVVDFLRRTLRVERQIQTRPSGVGCVACRLKTSASYRVVPLADSILSVLSEHIREFPPVEVEVDDESDPSRPTRRKLLLLFTDSHGRPLHRHMFNRAVWRPACLRAAATLRERASGEMDAERAADLTRQAEALAAATQHDLRHFYASALIRAGLNPKVVAERLGHDDASLTLRVYSHLWPDDEDRSRQAVDEALNAAGDVPTMRPQTGS